MSRTTRLLVSGLVLMVAAACSEVPTETLDAPGPEFAKGKPPAAPSVTVSITSTNPGLLPDIGGDYVVTPSSDGAIDIRPACGSRWLDLQGMDPFIDGLDRSTCNGSRGAGYMFLKFPGIMTASTGACPDLDVPAQTVNANNFGVNSRYFFQTNTDNDGKYDDTQYTLVITNCMVSVSGNTRTVTASLGDLWEGQSGSVPVLADVSFIVNLTITQ